MTPSSQGVMRGQGTWHVPSTGRRAVGANPWIQPPTARVEGQRGSHSGPWGTEEGAQRCVGWEPKHGTRSARPVPSAQIQSL